MSRDSGLRIGPAPAAVIAVCWTAFIGYFFIVAWHPAGLVARMLPVLPADLIAAVSKLAGDGMPALGMLALIAVSAAGVGSLIARPFGISQDGPRTAVQFALGLAALSYLTFFTGLAGLFDRSGVILLGSALLATAIPGAFVFVHAIKGIVARGRVGGVYWAGWPDILFGAVFVCVVSFLAAKALLPAVFYDAVTYHLGVPNYYIQEGGIGYIPWDSYSNFPFVAEMLYALGMLVSGLRAAQLTSVLAFAAFALLIYDFTKRHVREVPPALPAILFIATPAFMENTLQFSNDLLLGYYSLMAVYCFFAYAEEGGRGWLALMGVFTGVCVGTKYIALVSICVPAFMAVAWLASGERKARARGAATTVLYFMLPAVIVAMPWLVKNFVHTGNPFYPAFYNMLGGDDMTGRLYAAHSMNNPTRIEGLKGLALHPWQLFMAGPGVVTAKYHAAAFLGPLIILTAPGLALVRGVPQSVRRLGMYTALLFVLWSMAFPLTRYLFPAIAALLIISSYAVVRLASGGAALRVVVSAGLAGCVVFGLCLGFYQVDNWTGAFGLAHADETDARYLSRRATDNDPAVLLHALPVYGYVNEKLPADARVLVIGDAQHLYIDRRHMYSYLSARTPWDVVRDSGGDPKKIMDYLDAQGVTHIVYNPAELVRLQRSGFVGYAEADNRYIDSFIGTPNVRQLTSSNISGRPVYLFEVVRDAGGR